ncbi:MAG TPA: substrate-binding domain-containing protein [Gemmatimonadaceae bacterium]|nr:substrate-binding domain-containing protein [Gemmatimonadaceae bacterium]
MRLTRILGIALIAGACAKSDAGKSRTIGVTLLTREDEFYRQLEQGLRDQAQKDSFTLVVTSGDRDLAKQQSEIDNFIVQKVAAIIVCPVDSKGIGPAIEKANAAGIPVFTADIAAQGGKVVAHVASNNTAGGALAAEYIAKAIGDKGEVGLIAERDVQSTIDREAGFTKALAAHPNIKLVATIDGSGTRDKALKAADDMLQAHPKLAGIFAINDESALGVLSSAQSHKMTKLVIVGYDAAPEAQKAITGGTPLRADVAQQPGEIGKKTIDAIAQHLAGKPVDAMIPVPVRIVDADSLKGAAK